MSRWSVEASTRTAQISRIFAIGAAASLLTLGIAADALAAAPALANASAEQADASDPTKPAGWSSDAWGTLQPMFTWLQGDCAAGDRCLRVEGTKPAGSTLDDGDAKWWSDPVAVKGGSRFAVGLQVRSTAMTRLMALATGTIGANQAKEQWFLLQEVPASTGWRSSAAASRWISRSSTPVSSATSRRSTSAPEAGR